MKTSQCPKLTFELLPNMRPKRSDTSIHATDRFYLKTYLISPCQRRWDRAIDKCLVKSEEYLVWMPVARQISLSLAPVSLSSNAPLYTSLLHAIVASIFPR